MEKAIHPVIIVMFVLGMLANIPPAIAFPAGSSQAGPESAALEVKKKFNFDVAAWLKGPDGELPDSIGTLKLDRPVSDYNFKNWTSRPYREGVALRERSQGDLQQILERDGKVLTIAYTFKNRPADFVQALLRHGKEKYGRYFLEYFQEDGEDNHHFRQFMRPRNRTRSLLFISGKNSLSVQVFHDDLEFLPDKEKMMTGVLSKFFPDLKIVLYRYLVDNTLNIDFIIGKNSMDDAYFSRLFPFAVKQAALANVMYSEEALWEKSKVYFLFHDQMALGWILASDCMAFDRIKDQGEMQKFIMEKFHNTYIYFTKEFGKKK